MQRRQVPYNLSMMLAKLSLITLVLYLTAVATAQDNSSSTKPSDSGPWHKIKSAEGHTKSKPVMVKFLVGTQKWRVTIKTSADKDNAGQSNPSSTLRIAVMTETIRNIENKPANWSQVDVLYDGKPGDSGVKVYSDGLSNDGQGKWFQLVITGYLSEYEVKVEDQSADDSPKASKPTKKKKKSDN